MMPEISVIVPAYNVGAYIEKCLLSLHRQTLKDIEIIVVNDGSADNTKYVCQKFASIDNRIKLINTANGGLVKARKIGIKVSHAQFIGFVDGDDWVDENYFEELLTAFKMHSDIDFVHTGYTEEHSNKKNIVYPKFDKPFMDININKVELIKKFLLDDIVTPSIWSKLVKRSYMEKIYLKQNDYQQIGEDILFFLGILLSCSKGYIDHQNIGYHYRVRTASMSHEINSEFNYKLFGLANEIRILLENNKIMDNLDRDALCFQFLMNCVSAPEFHNNGYVIENISKLDGRKIVLYGNGMVGNELYKWLVRFDKINIVGWVDEKNFNNMYFSHIDTVDNINNYDFDYVILCSIKDNLISSMKTALASRNVPACKIYEEFPKLYKKIM